MDDIILLAQRHGSGAATVAALRANGIRGARDIAALDSEELTRMTGLKPVAARRMRAEALRMLNDIANATEPDHAASGDLPGMGPSSVTARATPRLVLADVEARLVGGNASETNVEEQPSSPVEQEDGVNAEEASLLRHAWNPPAAASRSTDPSRWLPSFWRFG